MFNKKRIKELESLLDIEKKRNDVLLAKIDMIFSVSQQISTNVNRISQNIAPTPIPTYNISVADFAKTLQKFPKRSKCGLGSKCQFYYSIPSIEIDKIAGWVPL